MASSQQSRSDFIYGTAWKREQTVECVKAAIRAGFRSFDTACQPRHYREELVGEAIRDAFANKVIPERAELFLQTKFSRPKAQDPETCPYDLSSELEDQVHKSIGVSLSNLRHEPEVNSSTAYLDCVLLHSPYLDFADTLRAWRVLESYVPHKIRGLGISNAPLTVLKQLYDEATVKPMVVQLRFHPETDFEAATRRFCAEKNIMFQAHRVLKGNPVLLDTDVVGRVAELIGVDRPAALYLCITKGLAGNVKIVNGTKTVIHMEEDIEAFKKWEEFCQLEDDERKAEWESCMAGFRKLVGDSD